MAEETRSFDNRPRAKVLTHPTPGAEMYGQLAAYNCHHFSPGGARQMELQHKATRGAFRAPNGRESTGGGRGPNGGRGPSTAWAPSAGKERKREPGRAPRPLSKGSVKTNVDIINESAASSQKKGVLLPKEEKESEQALAYQAPEKKESTIIIKAKEGTVDRRAQRPGQPGFLNSGEENLQRDRGKTRRLGPPRGDRRMRVDIKKKSQFIAQNYKTEICRSHRQTNTCEYGKSCQFAHGIHELRPRHYGLKYKTQECKNYHSEGYCRFGSRCKFIHDEHRIRVAKDEFWLVSPSENLVRVEVVENEDRQAELSKLLSTTNLPEEQVKDPLNGPIQHPFPREFDAKYSEEATDVEALPNAQQPFYGSMPCQPGQEAYNPYAVPPNGMVYSMGANNSSGYYMQPPPYAPQSNYTPPYYGYSAYNPYSVPASGQVTG